METEDLAKEISRKYFGDNAKVIKKLVTTNNDVYIVSLKDKNYVLKFYRSKTWPENGKNLLVNSLLEQNNIPYAKVIGYDRDCELFGGYILEERILGDSVDMGHLSCKLGEKYYSLLAKFIKKVHNIKFDKFGYLNNGNPLYSNFYDFLKDDFEDHARSLLKDKLINEKQMNVIKKKFKMVFEKSNYTPCLCHGDLSLRNAIIDGEKLVLIDYDDASALPALADIARMTFDMREYVESPKWRVSFLNSYFENNEQIKEFEKFEKTYHIYCAIDWMDFAISKNHKFDDLLEYLRELLES